MKLKSGHNFSFKLLFILGLSVAGLLLFKSSFESKNKYPSAPKVEQTTPLNLVQITVNEPEFAKLKKKRDKAISIGILETNDNDYVPATITFDGEEYQAEIRLKGDWTDHLEGIKWSFRVKLRDDRTILGMRKFSLHHPGTRRFLNEWMYHRAMKRENLMGLRYHFVEGKIHVKTGHKSYLNKDVGIYALEETFDKRTIESNKRKESVIIKFSEDYWWNEVKKSNSIAKQYGKGTLDFLNAPLIGRAKHPITVFSESKVLEDSTMHHYFKTAKNLLEDLRSGNLSVSQVFDTKKLAMDTALMNLFGAVHATNQINVRYYYNPITSRLEPISFDGYSGVKLQAFKYFIFSGKIKDSLYLKELAFALHKVSQPQYLNELISENEKEFENLDKILKTEFKQPSLFNKENLVYNQNIIKQELEKLKQDLSLTELNSGMEETKKLGTRGLSNMNLWDSRGTTLELGTNKYNQQESYKIKRISGDNPGFVSCSNVKVNFGSTIEVSMLVKKTGNNAIFGFRIQDVYPSRVDAIFDLNSGKLLEISKNGSFENEKARITELKNGWYKCVIEAQVNCSKLNIIFGPSAPEKKAFNWEGPTSNKSSIFIIPNSLEIKEY